MRTSTTLLFSFISLFGAAQPGSLDTTFNADDIGFGFGDGAGEAVYATALLPDGRIIIGGVFGQYNGISYSSQVARLQTDGRVDTSFTNGLGPNGIVFTVAVQDDGKILIGGNFTSYDGTSLFCSLARLNVNGSLDIDFDPPNLSGEVHSILVQPDGSILVAGTSPWKIRRLETNGVLDPSWQGGTWANSDVLTMALQSDGKVFIGGDFTYFNGQSRAHIARLNGDGTLDTGFSALTTETDGPVRSITLQPDGKVLIGGGFTSYNGTQRPNFARLHPTGILDAGFNTYIGTDGVVNSTAVQADGSVLIGGDFTTCEGIGRVRLARLSADGIVDVDFDPGAGAEAPVNTLLVQPDGKILMGGDFILYNDTTRNRITRLELNGAADPTFNRGTGANSVIITMAVQVDGKIFIGGTFTMFDGTKRMHIARLHPDGTLDMSFDPGAGADGAVHDIAIQPDGQIMIVGDFAEYAGADRNRIARLNSDGSLDASFDPGIGVTGGVEVVALQADGKILIGGNFTYYDGNACNRIARLEPDGTLDVGFGAGAGANSQVYDIAVQTDGKIMVGGSFWTYDGITSKYLARLDTGGVFDPSFNVGSDLDASVWAIGIQSDGSYVIGGNFHSYGGNPSEGIVRLNVDGSYDPSFAVGDGFGLGSHYVYAIRFQADGKVLVGGGLYAYDGIGCNNFVRINTDGSQDLTFEMGSGAQATLYDLSIVEDDKIIICGGFVSYDGTGRNRIARINSDDLSTLIQGLSNAGPRVFPNPSQGLFALTGLDQGPSDLRIIDLSGRIVLDQKGIRVSSDALVVDLTSQPPGAYIFSLGASHGSEPIFSTVLVTTPY